MINAYSSLSQANSDLETATIKANYDKQIEAANAHGREEKGKAGEEERCGAKKAKTEQNNKAMKIEITLRLLHKTPCQQ